MATATTSGDGGSAARSQGSTSVLPPRAERWIVAALLALCAINMVAAAARNSAVADELGAHIPAGYLYWTSGEFGGGIDNFPLGQLWIALPVKLLGLDYELFTEQHLLLFRLPVIVLGVFVVGLIGLFARGIHGQVAGLAALFLASVSPNLLAHSTLATLDLPATACIAAAVWLLFRYARQPSFGRLAAAAAITNAALLVKVQAVMLLPVAAVALVLAALRRRRQHEPVFPGMAASWLLFPAGFLVLANLIYLHWPMVDGQLLPGALLDAFSGKLSHGAEGHFAYLCGEYSARGWWYYFPVAILLKTPLPALVLVAIGLARRPRRDEIVFVLLPVVLLLGAAMVGRIDIGLRHVLPIYPFLLVVAGAGAARLAGWRSGRAVLGALLLVCAIEAAWIQPHQLSYFNQLAGGPTNGHRFLLDSNYDWGQNDRFLARHVARSGLDYAIDPDPFRPAAGPILVNANALYGVLNGGPSAYAWLRDRAPDQRVAYTWFEYRLPGSREATGPPDWAVMDRLGGHLEWLRTTDPAVASSGVRLVAAQASAEATLYGPSFDLIRAILRDRPNDESALRLGGELIVRHKLGVLRYREDEYLEGFRDPPAPAELSADQLVRLATDAGMARTMSTLYTLIGAARFQDRDLDGAIRANRLAATLDPSNEVAADNLRQLGNIKARLPR